MKKKIILLIFLIAFFSKIYPYYINSYNMDYGGNLWGHISDGTIPTNVSSDLGYTPEDIWIMKNVDAKSGNLTKNPSPIDDYLCTTDGVCFKDTPLPENTVIIPNIKKEKPVDYITQKCINVGYIPLDTFPYTYKCISGTVYSICVKSNNSLGYITEEHLFSNLKKATENRLRKGLDCYFDKTSQTNDSETKENDNLSEKNTVDNAIINTSFLNKIMFSMIFKDTEPVIDYHSNYIFRNSDIYPHFFINYEMNKDYKNKDINVTVYFDSKDFNLENEIYAFVSTSKDYDNLLSKINEFVKTTNLEYVKIIDKYKFTNINNIEKIKFIPNKDTFQFTIDKDNNNKEFVIVFLQKINEQLNISYSNFYILNNEELVNKLHCEANRNVLTFFCNKYLNPECETKLRNCFNHYILDIDEINISEFVYSGSSSIIVSQETTEPQLPKDEPKPLPDSSTESINDRFYLYTVKNNVGESCSNAGLDLGQWGCVCTTYKGIKNVVAAKCTKSNGLVLYDSRTCKTSAECKNATFFNNDNKVTICYNLSAIVCK